MHKIIARPPEIIKPNRRVLPRIKASPCRTTGEVLMSSSLFKERVHRFICYLNRALDTVNLSNGTTINIPKDGSHIVITFEQDKRLMSYIRLHEKVVLEHFQTALINTYKKVGHTMGQYTKEHPQLFPKVYKLITPENSIAIPITCLMLSRFNNFYMALVPELNKAAIDIAINLSLDEDTLEESLELLQLFAKGLHKPYKQKPQDEFVLTNYQGNQKSGYQLQIHHIDMADETAINLCPDYEQLRNSVSHECFKMLQEIGYTLTVYNAHVYAENRNKVLNRSLQTAFHTIIQHTYSEKRSKKALNQLITVNTENGTEVLIISLKHLANIFPNIELFHMFMDKELSYQNIPRTPLSFLETLSLFEALNIHEFVQSKESDSEADNNPPDEFLCPITKELMNEPVIDEFGHTYEHAALLQSKLHQNRSPLTNNPYNSEILIPNRAIKSQIEEYKKRHSETEL